MRVHTSIRSHLHRSLASSRILFHMDGQTQGQTGTQGQGPPGIGKGKGKGEDQEYTLWVGNIPQLWTEKTFNSYFKQFGDTWNTYLGGACGTSSSDQWGKVSYSDYDNAQEALNETNGLQVEYPPGHPNAQVWKLTVRWYDGHRDEDKRFEQLTVEEQLNTPKSTPCLE